MAGKGSTPRPFSVDSKTYADNWDAIFNKKKPTTAEQFDQAIMKDEYYDLEDVDTRSDRDHTPGL